MESIELDSPEKDAQSLSPLIASTFLPFWLAQCSSDKSAIASGNSFFFFPAGRKRRD